MTAHEKCKWGGTTALTKQRKWRCSAQINVFWKNQPCVDCIKITVIRFLYYCSFLNEQSHLSIPHNLAKCKYITDPDRRVRHAGDVT